MQDDDSGEVEDVVIHELVVQVVAELIDDGVVFLAGESLFKTEVVHDLKLRGDCLVVRVVVVDEYVDLGKLLEFGEQVMAVVS